MAKASAAAEPSMEEILASIRRIISDDAAAPEEKPEPVKAAAKPAPKPAAEHVSEDDLDKLFASGNDDIDALMMMPEPAAEEEDEVLDLVEMVADEEPLDLVEGLHPDEADVAFVDPTPQPEEDDFAAAMIEDEEIVEEPAPPPPPPPKAARPAPPRIEPVYEPVEEAEPLVSERAGASVNAAFGSLTHTILANNAKTLDDLVKEMLRPMLKAWLDENLPVVVERLVRAEIERVSRGR